MERVNSKTVNIVLLLILFVFVSFISIGYSVLNADLMISGDLEYEKGEELHDLIITKSKGMDTNMDFGVEPTKETSGLYKMDGTKDDKYPIYYYRGIVSNNNVKFARFCWKMVRTTSTGGIKIIYNGVPAENGSCNNTGDASLIGKEAYNTSYISKNDVSYVYDDGTDSNIKKKIDEWYEDNMTSYTGMLEDTEWCNDRGVYKINGTYTSFEGLIRNYETTQPSIICANDNDKLSVKNGKLKYPVATLIADEITLAGQGWKGYTTSGYLNIGVHWWTLTPYDCYDASLTNVFYANSDGYMYGVRVDFALGLRPAVSIAPGIAITDGDGSVSNPYIIGS